MSHDELRHRIRSSPQEGRPLGPGDKIGRYAIEELLGEGGMGRVYRAYDATLNRRVAIKLLRPDDDAPPADDATTAPSVARVLREARMAAALDHPNVVSIFDVGEQAGTAFIVMELVTGRSLRHCIGHPEIPVSERVHWLLGIARALAAAHRAGLMHRDVKPENVLVRDDGVVKVLDFGIARLERMPSQRPPPLRPSDAPRSAYDTGTTVESTLAGTPAYMAPEQIRREGVDARVDQFAWGVVAYELLTGRLPWTPPTRESPSLFLAVLEQPAPQLSSAELGVAESFLATVGRALSKRREERFASMDELLVASGLAWSQGDLPSPGPRPSLRTSPDSSGEMRIGGDIASAPTLLATHSAGALAAAASGAVERQRSSTRRRRLALAGALAILLGTAAVVGRMVVIPYRDHAREVEARWAQAASATVAPFAFHPRDARRLTFEQGCEEYPSLAPDGAAVAFDTAVGDDIHVVVLDLASSRERRVTSQPGWHFSPSISPDGKSIAFLRQHGDEVGSWIVPFDGSSPGRVVANGRVRPTWSPDGRAVWAGPADAPQRIDLATGTVTRTLAPPAGFFIVRTRELQDGRVVARLLDRETKRGRGLVVYDGAGAPAPLFQDATEDAIGVVPDGSRLLVPKLLLPTERVELWQLPLDGSPPSALATNIVLPTKGLDLGHDGSVVVWSTCSTEQDLATLGEATEKTTQARSLLPKGEWTDEQPAGVPGAPTKLVVVSDRAGRRQLWLLDRSGKEAAKPLPLGDLEAAAPAVSPDGRRVAFTAIGRGIHVAPIDGASPPQRLTNGADDTAPTFARDGESLYFETASGAKGRAVARVRVDGSAPPLVLLDDAERPAASPAEDLVAFIAMEGEQGTPTIYDAATRKRRRLSSALGKGLYNTLRFSPDGKRIAVGIGLTELVEVDASTGAILRRFTSGDQISSTTYLGRELVIARMGWRGDVWLAKDALR